MENVIKKLFLGGSLLTALAVSLTALGVHADTITDETGAGANGTSKFTINVPKTIVLTNVTDGAIASGNVSYDAINTTTISATVQANTKYALYLSATQPDLVGENDASQKIPAISGSNAITAGTNGWGIMKSGDSVYTGITDKLQLFYQSGDITNGATATTTNGATTTFNVGVGVANSLPSDTYLTNVTVTASTDLTLGESAASN